jgi:DNA-directed RNA polymerase II subunit RPB2
MTSPLSCLTEPLIQQLLESHSHVHGYSDFQKNSFEHFMDELLPFIVEEHSEIVYDSKSTGQRHVVTFGQLTMAKPNHRESDGKVVMMLPEEARLRQLDYCLPVMLDVRHQIFQLKEGGAPVLLQDYLHREVPFCDIPVMLQTRYCHLHATPRFASTHAWDGSSEKRAKAECPYDEGGYFIIRGLERGLQVQETLRTNHALIFPVKQPNKYMFLCEVRSRHESKMRSTSTLKVYVTTRKGGCPPEIFLAMPFLPYVDVPLIMVLRLLGYDDHAQLLQLIVPGGVEGEDAHLVPLVKAVLAHTSNRMNLDELYDYMGKEGTRETSLEARKRYVSHLMANELLPHLGYSSQSPDTSRKKVVYLCIIVRRLLRAYAHASSDYSGVEEEARRVVEVDDRDDYSNKRLTLPGTMIALLFRQLMRQFVKNLRRYMYITIENKRYLNLADAVNNRKISAALRFAFRTGNWSVQRSSSGNHVGVTQVIQRMSHTALQSQIRRVNTPICREGKATHIRQARVSHWGILCPSETPEGSGCGLVKNLSILAHVRIGTPASLLVGVLVNHLGVTPFEQVEEAAGKPLVIVNGDIVGTCDAPLELVARARRARRQQNLPFDTSVVLLPRGTGVLLHSDAGCCLRPLFVLEAMHELPEMLARAARDPTVELWSFLVQHGMIEYVDKDEERELHVAVTPAEVLAAGETGTYTHLEIHPASILGHCAIQIPFPDRNQAPRNFYQSAMGKQSIAYASLAYDNRMDAQMHVPYYTQRPLVETGFEKRDFGTGVNAVVAIMMYGGHNQEDSLIVNKAFVERGGFRSTYYTVYSAEERSMGADTECFENPARAASAGSVPLSGGATCVGLKQADYSKLDGLGTVSVGVTVKDNTALIGKTMSTPKFHAGKGITVKRDRSVVLQMEEDAECRVDRVMLTTNREGMTSQRVRLRTTRVPTVGDKFSSRHGQKGTVGILLPQEDMPFSAQTGITPDIIVNPCAIPSRMTIAHLVECVASKSGALLGHFSDGLAFRQVSVESMCDALHSAGYQRHGNEMLVNGMTGEPMEALIFMGPTFYQKLKHMTDDKVHSRTTGPRTIMTRQPVEGRARKGGLRVGEMERDVFVTYGASKVIMERMLYASDAFQMPVCTTCGQIAENKHNPEFGASVKGQQAYCRLCDAYDVEEVVMPYPYKLLLQELSAIGINIKHEFRKE